MLINEDSKMNAIENYLTKISFYPVVGTFSGLAKSLLALAQITNAVACAAFSIFPCIMANDYALFNHNFTHIVHGFGNLFVSLFEAIPFISMILHQIRTNRSQKNMDCNVAPYSGHEHKFLPYPSLVRFNFVVFGEFAPSSRSVEYAKNIYRELITKHGGKELNIPLKLREQFAWQSANKAADEGVYCDIDAA